MFEAGQQALAPGQGRDMTIPILIAIALLMACGIGLLAAGLLAKADRRTLRIQLVKSKTVVKETEARASENLRQKEAAGFNEGEYRQIIALLAKRGVPAHLAETYFSAFRVILALSVALLSMLWMPAGMQFALRAAAFIFVAIVIWFIPKWYVSRKAKQHRRAVAQGLADALELMAICMEAGIALEGGLERVARELKSSHPALSEELARTWAEISILPNRELALSNFAARINLPSVRSVVGMLIQSFRYGTPLVSGLRVAAAEIRSDQITQLEEKANRLPALMTVPVMVFIMPTIFLIVGGPAVIRVMTAFG
jgi:tight adherence protein C